MKARFCVEGRRALYAFLESHKIDYRKCGKLVVATQEAEVAGIEAIFERATANGVENLEHLTGAQARALEPALNAHSAILSPESGLFASHDYMLALQGEIEDAGGSVVVSTPFERAEPLPGGGFTVTAGGEGGAALTTRLLVTAPGLQAQAVAARILDLTLKRQHIVVAGEDPALGRQDGGVGVEFRLQRPRLGARQVFQPLDTIGRRLLEDGLDARHLGQLGRHDQLAALPMVDLATVQEVVERAPSLDAELRLQRARRIIEPPMDDL